MGPEIAELERQLAEFCGAPHVVVCANGTDALKLALRALKIGPGDAVPIPPSGWHQIRNTGRETLRFLCCCAPPYRHEDTFLAEQAVE